MHEHPDLPIAGRRPSTLAAANIRWLSLAVILLGAVGLMILLMAGSETDRQQGVMRCMVVVMAAFALGLFWLILFSGLTRNLRLAGLGGVVALLLAGFGLFEIKGTSGDLMPIIGWRFQSDDLALPETADAAGRVAARIPPGAVDFPQFFGPQRDGKLAGPALASDWRAQPPEELWRREVGAGWSGFAVAGGIAITQEQRGELEAVVAYHLATGEPLWTHTDQARYFTTLGGLGPRATPTIADGRVFTLGATGMLNCLELESGKALWSIDILKENAAVLPQWGVAGSPLIFDDLVIVNPGGPSRRSLVAYRAATGEVAWAGGSNEANWSSPVVATLRGTPQILMFGAEGVAAHDVTDGSVLWDYPWKGGHPHVSLPLALGGDRVLISSGYGTGSELLEITRGDDGRFEAARYWRSIAMKAKFANLIHLDGYVYGLDDGALACIDANTGRRAWKGDRFGHGQMLLVGNTFLLMAENGDVILFEPNPNEQRELTRFSALSGKTWNPPAVAGQYLLARNDKEAACFRLPTKASEKPAETTL